MKELQFYRKYILQWIGVFLLASAVIAFGSWMTADQSSSNLFRTYLNMAPFFCLLCSWIFAQSSRYYIELAITFGATRKKSFWALQGLLLGLNVMMIAIVIVLNDFNLSLPQPEGLWVSSLQGLQWVQFSLATFMFGQLGFCLSRVKQTKVLGIIVGIMMGVGSSLATGTVIALSRRGMEVSVFSPDSAWYWGSCGVLLVFTIGLLVFANHLYARVSVRA